MSESSSLLDFLPEETLFRLEGTCCRFEEAWQAGQRPVVEDYLGGVDGRERMAWLRELVSLELHYRRLAGEHPGLPDYQTRFPDAIALLLQLFPQEDPPPARTPPPRPRPNGQAIGRPPTKRDTDYNLLFGVLALQLELIDNDRFARACGYWAVDKNRPLAEILVEQGWLTPDDREDVEKLLQRKLTKHGGDVHASLAEAVHGAGTPSLAGVQDLEVQASLAAVAATPDSERTTDFQPMPAGMRYQILRPHAEGGLGKVFVAEDGELHREVALKEIKKEHADKGSSRARFVLEAEITGGLEHPGIVPVYGLGCYPDGRPYYAMRFIKGDNLKTAIEHFHAQTLVRFDSLEFRQLLGRFVDVCQAVAYAHSRGVLHRDLKPGNIMLGKFGETLVVDWGLAKVVGRGDVGEEPGHGEATLRPSGSWEVETKTGLAVGTPAFMSPEQAGGRLDELGPATDVYSLGATLYMLLTKQGPFQGKVEEVLPKVERGAWVSARQVNAAVPAALEAICAKAMALRPGDRYGSALALAEDVEHWMADEPVKAYPEPVGARLRRWMRQHPRRVTGAVVLLLATVFGLVLGTVLLNIAKKEAEDNFQYASREVNHYVREVSEDILLNEPGMEELRSKLLLEALNYYQEFLEKRPQDAKVQQQLAEAKRQLGELYGQVGQMVQAIGQAKEAVEGYEGLQARAPADEELRFGLARSYLALAELQVNSGEPESGRANVSRAIDLLSSLTADNPEGDLLGIAKYWILLSRSYDLRATAEAHLGNAGAALRNNKEAVHAAELIIFQNYTNIYEYWGWGVEIGGGMGLNTPGKHNRFDPNFIWILNSYSLLGRVYCNEGINLKSNGQKLRSARRFEYAIQVWRQLSEQNPRMRKGLANALLNAGQVEVERGRPAQGEAYLREALDFSRQLVRDDFTVVRGRHPLNEFDAVLVGAKGYLGEALFASGRTREAAELLREAVEGSGELLASPIRTRALLTDHAHFLYILGRLEADRGRFDEALGTCQKAREEQEKALAEASGDRSLRNDLLATREAIAEIRFLKGEIGRDDWVVEERQILRARQDNVGPEPGSGYFQAEVSVSAALLARVLVQAGRSQEALKVVEGVLPAHERLVQAEQKRWQDEMSWDDREQLNNKGSGGRIRPSAKPGYLTEPRRLNDEDPPLEDIIPNSGGSRVLRRPMVPPSCELWRQQAKLLALKGAALARIGQGGPAREATDRAIALGEQSVRGEGCYFCPPCSWSSVWFAIAGELYRQNPEPCHLYDLACHLALASTLPGNSGFADPAGRAVQTLRDYVASGFDNPYKLRNDPALEPLQKRDDFQKLVCDMEIRTQVRKEAR